MPFTQYQGFDVIEVEPSFEDPARTYMRNVFRFEAPMGKVTPLDRSGVAIVEASGFRWVMQDRSEIQVYRDFIVNRKGACVPFWVPSWKSDLPMAADLPSGTGNLSIQKIGYTKFMFSTPARRRLAFILADRTKFYRKVTATADGATETLTIDSSFGFTIPASTTMVCFLTLCRLKFDNPKLTWHNSNVASTVLDFVELPMEVPA